MRGGGAVMPLGFQLQDQLIVLLTVATMAILMEAFFANSCRHRMLESCMHPKMGAVRRTEMQDQGGL